MHDHRCIHTIVFGIAYVACYLLKLPHNIAAPAGMIGASNFFELAVAVAIALFGTTSEAALATTVCLNRSSGNAYACKNCK